MSDWGKKANEFYKEVVPTNVRAYVKAAVGDNSPIDNSFFTKKELDVLKMAAIDAQQNGSSEGFFGEDERKQINYHNYKGKGSSPQKFSDFFTPAGRMVSTIGGATLKNEGRETILTDVYDFNGSSDTFSDMVSGVVRNIKDGDLYGAARWAGAYIAPEGSKNAYPVRINLGDLTMPSPTTSLMPHIPSSAELGFMGSMAKTMPDGASPGTNWGRNGDQHVVHAAPGEMMVPPEVLQQYPELGQIIGQALSSMGADPNRYVVGSPQSSINPYTGQPEFFFKSIKKALKKLTSSTLGRILIPVAASFALGPAGLGLTSAATGAAIGSGVATKLSGGSWGQALGAGLGSYVGSTFAPGANIVGPAGTVGATLASNGLGSIASVLPGSLLTQNLASMAGGWLGSNLGETVGGMIDPPEMKWGSEFANAPTLAAINTTLPSTNQDPTLELPGASTDGTAPTKGSGVNPNIPSGGVNYLTQVKDRDTGNMRTINAAFSGNFGNNRRSSWGSGVAFV